MRCGWACEIRKQPAIKQSPANQLFLFSYWLLYECFFSLVIKAFASFEKLIRFYQQAFTVYKNGENLKILIEIFRQKLLVSNVTLAFLDHLKSKIFFLGQPWWLTCSAPCSLLSPSLSGVDLLLSPQFTQKRSFSSYNSPHERQNRSTFWFAIFEFHVHSTLMK